ncbi:MAG: divergent PAP2 family protein [Kiritimatiellae bacterium]|nr:divergent PAP2 family protein [Kiritimatiellia bacterium]
MQWPQWSWLRNTAVWTTFLAWLLAQSAKVLGHLVRTGRIDFHYLVKLGGMPSAHSAAVGALATAVGLRQGFDSTLFAVAGTFAIVVMFDAQTVRRSAGVQARILNQMMDSLVREHRWPDQSKLVELFGHTRLEVFLGMIMGILMALLIHAYTV